MARRILLLVALVVPILVLVWVGRTHRSYGNLKSDLTPAEIKDAVDVLSRERKMWASFDGVSGDINVKMDTAASGPSGHLAIAGKMVVKRLEPLRGDKRQTIARYELTLSGNGNAWSFHSDGTDSKVTCDDAQLADTIERVAPTILPILTSQISVLVPLVEDELCPSGRVKTENLPNIWVPFHSTDASNTPHSYYFKHASGALGDLTFVNGRFAGWKRTGESADPATFSAEDPVESNGFWFPTRIQCEMRGSKYNIELSNVVITTVSRGDFNPTRKEVK